MKKGAIFDLDGTILDSMGIWNEIDYEFFKRRNMPVPQDYLEAITPMSFKEAAHYTKHRFHLQETEEQLIEEWMEMAYYKYANEIILKPGAKEYLNQLKQQGVKLCVATSSHHNLFEPCLKRNGIFELFDDFVTVAEVARGKKFPDVYLEAAKRLELKPDQCEVYEDIIEAVGGALAGGFEVTCVLDPRNVKDHEQMKKMAHRSIINYLPLLEK